MSHLLGSTNAFNVIVSAIKTVRAGDTGPLVFLLRTKEAAEGAGGEVATPFLPSQWPAEGLLSAHQEQLRSPGSVKSLFFIFQPMNLSTEIQEDQYLFQKPTTHSTRQR